MVFLTGCELEPQVQISANPLGPVLIVPSSGYAYNFTTESNTDQVQFVFSKADYGFIAPITYKVQIDKRGGDFSRPRNLVFGDTDTLTISVKTFNEQVLKLKFNKDQVAELDMRVTSSVSEYYDDIVSPVIPISFSVY